MEEVATQMGAMYVAVYRVAKLKRSKKVREGWAAVAIVCGDKLLCFKRTVEGGQGEIERMLPGGKRDVENRGGESEHDAAVRYLDTANSRVHRLLTFDTRGLVLILV